MAEEEIIENEAVAEEEGGTEIRDTDIVFDCPHCGHNLAIDYRGAGLQIECVNCGESVLVPIPTGMKIDDLDIEPGEILKQLFATRRNLQKAETTCELLRAELDEANATSDRLLARIASLAESIGELKNLCNRAAAFHAELTCTIEGIEAAANAPDVAAEEGAGEEADEGEEEAAGE